MKAPTLQKVIVVSYEFGNKTPYKCFYAPGWVKGGDLKEHMNPFVVGKNIDDVVKKAKKIEPPGYVAFTILVEEKDL